MDLPSENRRLFAQVAFFSGDEHVRREADPWRDATPQERLDAMAVLCQQAARFLAQLEPSRRARAEAPAPLPEDSTKLLAALRAGGR